MSEELRDEARRMVGEPPAPAGQGGGEERRGEGVGGEAPVSEDVEELRGVLKAISDFLRDIEEPISKLLNSLMKALDGAKLGEEVAAFYRSLKEAGMPEEAAMQLTREFFKARLESLNIPSMISRWLGGQGREEGGEEG